MPQLNKIRQLEQKRNKNNSLHKLIKQKGVIIYRVSTHGQAKEGWSLEAQRKYLRAHAELHNIEIVQEFEEQESAKKSGRKIFNEMIKYLKKHRNVTNILVEKTDRLYRNFKDYVILDELGINIHFVKENQVICPESRSHEKFVHGIKVLMAKNYIDNLREEIMKGLNEKAEEGYYPGRAPVGYINHRDKETKKSYLIPDKNRAMFIRRIFVYYSQGNISMKNLAKYIGEEGFRTVKNHLPTARTIEVILQNPIYTGNFYWRGELYKGKHKPIVEQSLFDKVDAMFNQPARAKKRKHELTFAGVFRCEICGSLMTGEVQTGANNSGEYEYYKCANPKCKKYYVSGKVIENKVIDLFEKIRIKPQFVDPIKKGLLELHQIRKNEDNENLINIQKQLRETKNKLDMLTEKLLENVIDNEVYKMKQSELMSKRIRLEERERELHKNSDKFAQHVENIIELCKTAPNLYKDASKAKKRQLLKLVISNPKIKGKELSLELNPVFESVSNYANLIKCGGYSLSSKRLCSLSLMIPILLGNFKILH